MEQQQKNATPEQRSLVIWLRSKAGMKRRQGVLNGRRYDYFKGSSAVKALLSPAYAKLSSMPKVTTEDEAKALLHSIIPHAFYLRVERQGALAPPSTGGQISSTPSPQIRIYKSLSNNSFNPTPITSGFTKVVN